MAHKPKRAIILLGGGARAAYQLGVLKAVGEHLPKGAASPFNIICGTSAGAINAVSLATMSDNYNHAVAQLMRVWGNFHVSHVFKSDMASLLKTGFRFFGAITLGGFMKRKPLAFLNRQPLRELLLNRLNFDRIQEVIDDGHLHAVSITTSGYTSGQSVTFFQAIDEINGWKRVRRLGCKSKLTLDHIMASSAIPFLFQAIKVNREYFGDGSMRQMSPLSSAIHLGADKLLVVGNLDDADHAPPRGTTVEQPNFAQIAGNILDSIFLDNLESDLERLERINKTVDIIPQRKLKNTELPLRKIDVDVISPSADISTLAHKYIQDLPRTIRYLLKGLGALRTSDSALASYLLFERRYCRELIRLGYEDTKKQNDIIADFLTD